MNEEWKDIQSNTQEEKFYNMRKDKMQLKNMALTFSAERNREREKAINQLAKFKEFESSHTMYRYVFPNGMIISSSKKENVEYMKEVFEARK